MLTWMLNATYSVGALVAVTRLACSCGLVGWLVWAAALPVEWRVAAQEPGVGHPPVSESVPIATSALPGSTPVSPPVGQGWKPAKAPAATSPAAPLAASVLREGYERIFTFSDDLRRRTPGEAPPAATSQTATLEAALPARSRGDATVQELLQLRERLGTGLGSAEDFLAALELVVQDQASEATSPPGRSGPVQGSRDGLLFSRQPFSRQPSGFQPQMLRQSGGPVAEGPSSLAPLPARGQWAPPFGSELQPGPAVRQVGGFQPSVNQGPAPQTPEASQSLRRAARSLEEAAWELEAVRDYEAADHLRRQAFELYRRSR